MKKIVALILAVAMMFTPVNTHAEINMSWSPDARDEVYLDFYARTNKKGQIEVERSHTRHTITYVPGQVTAKAYADHITVSADMTTASCGIVIQWSTDENFKKNVNVMTRQNPKYKGPVYGYLKYDYKCNSKGSDYVGERRMVQGDRLLGYRKLVSHSEWDCLTINYQAVNSSRKGVTSIQSYRIPVRYGRKYFVRVYLVYKGRYKKLNSRKVTVKVR